jgi:hypothetical protein
METHEDEMKKNLCACGAKKGKGDCAECEADRDWETMSFEAFDAKWGHRNPKKEAAEQRQATTCAECEGEFGEDCPFASTRDTALCKDCYLNAHLDEDGTDDE